MKNFLFDFVKQLVKNNIDFVICGGVACILQGCDRTTMDLDINVYFKNENLERLIKFLKKNKFSPRIPEPVENLLLKEKRDQWVKQKNALVYTVHSPDGLLQIDIFLKYPIEYCDLADNADLMSIDGVNSRFIFPPIPALKFTKIGYQIEKFPACFDGKNNAGSTVA